MGVAHYAVGLTLVAAVLSLLLFIEIPRLELPQIPTISNDIKKESEIVCYQCLLFSNSALSR